MAEIVAVRVPNENVNDETVTILRWLVEDGQSVQAEQSLVEVETSKASFEVPAPTAGVVKAVVKAGEDVAVGAPLCYVGPSLEEIEKELAVTTAAAAPVPAVIPATPVAVAAPVQEAMPVVDDAAPANTTRFSAEAMALIKSRGLDVKVFQGRGLVRAAQVRAYLGEGIESDDLRGSGAGKVAMEATLPAAGQRPTPRDGTVVPAVNVPVVAERVPRAKLMEIKYLASSQSHTLPSAVWVQVPTRGLQALKQANPQAAELLAGAAIFEAGRLLRKYRQFNAFFADGSIHYYQRVNIGFAIDAGQGLKVPVIPDADTKTLPQIVQEQREHLVNYLEGTLLPPALAGGTFTITDLSSEGVAGFAPVINQGQSAILGVTAEVSVAPGQGYYQLILAFDHQVAEGRVAAKFLGELRHRLMGYEQSLQQAPQPKPAEPACYRCQTPLSELPRGHYLLHAMVKDRSEPQPLCTVCVEDF